MKITLIAIPQGMTFADLRLARDPQTGDVSFRHGHHRAHRARERSTAWLFYGSRR